MRLMALAAMAATMTWSAAAAQAPAAAWGSRGPTVCTALKSPAPPTAAQAAQLVRCAQERASDASGELRLMEDLKVEIGGSTRFAAMYNIFTMPDADTTKAVYPIRGSWTWSVCILRHDAGIYGNPDLNCNEAAVPEGKGVCWRNTFAEWKCNMNGSAGARGPRVRPRRPA